MRADHSCFGFQAPRTDGLFFGLFPDAAAALQLKRTAQQLGIRHRLGGRLIATERFHVSLLGFGEHAGLPQSLVAKLVDAAMTISMPSFDVTFDRAISFLGSPRPLVLCGDRGIAELAAFQRALCSAVRKIGLARVKPRYTPHVTLLYDERGIDEHAIEPIGWTVHEFALVHSLRGRSRYFALGRWPLGSPLSLAS
jgi:2'-5' RNA ligase